MRVSTSTLPRTTNRLLVTYVFVASVLLHLVAVPGWAWWLGQEREHIAEPVRAHCAEQASAQEPLVQRPCRNSVACEAARRESVTVALVDEREPKEEPPPETQQVVSPPLEAEAEELAPPDARFSSTVNTSVERETVARNQGAAAGSAAARSRSVPQPQGSQGEARGPRVESPRVEPIRPEEDGRPPSEQERAVGTEVTEPRLEELLPNFESEQLAAAMAPGPDGAVGDGSIDYLRDVSEDERTLLNRRRVSYADFYERIKLGVVAHWNPISVYRRRDPSGRIYGVEDRLTVLNVTLRGDGTLAKLYVERSSGLDFLDEEAVRAMNAAVPFPNPPEGLKDLNGQVNFRFAFQVDVSTRQYRMFRYR